MRQLINVEEHYICPSVNKKMFDYLTAHTLIDLEDNTRYNLSVLDGTLL